MPSTARERLRFLFLPWWRVVWLIASVVWAIVLNVIYITGGGTPEWVGPLSVVPIYAFLADLLVRDSRRRARPRP